MGYTGGHVRIKIGIRCAPPLLRSEAQQAPTARCSLRWPGVWPLPALQPQGLPSLIETDGTPWRESPMAQFALAELLAGAQRSASTTSIGQCINNKHSTEPNTLHLALQSSIYGSIGCKHKQHGDAAVWSTAVHHCLARVKGCNVRLKYIHIIHRKFRNLVKVGVSCLFRCLSVEQ